VEEGREAADGLLAGQRDAAVAFEAVEEALDEVALLVERPVRVWLVGAGGVGLDLRLRAEAVGDEGAQGIGVSGGVFPRLMSAGGPRDGDAESGEAVEDGDADLELGGLSVEIAGHELLAEQLHAVHPLTGRALRGNVPRGLVSTRLRRW
jgi:hypothetical protein